MKKGAYRLWLALAFSLGFAAGPAWAFQCPDLYAECQQLLKTKKNEEAKKLCEEGIKLHEAGGHDDAIEKLDAGLNLLKKQ